MPSSSLPSSSTKQPLIMAATASTLAEKARSTSQLIDNSLLSSSSPSSPFPSASSTDPFSNPSISRLTSLSAKLLQFNQHANTLGDCLTSASTSGVAEVLAAMLERGLRRCDEAVGVIRGKVEGLVHGHASVLHLQQPGTEAEAGKANVKGAENGTEKGKSKKEVDGQVVQEYEDLLIAYSRLFIFGSQIVILNQKEQAEWMVKNDVDKMIDDAEEAAGKVLVGKSILRDLQ